jgi:iron-sulfur cluster insertion protein
LTSTHFLPAALTYPVGTPTLLDMNDTATETVPEALEAPLLFTDAAARKVSELIAGEGNPKLMLRVFVQGGGCSGLQYGFEFDEQVQDGDTCVENQGVKLLIDPMSFQYLGGAEIDFRDNLEGAQFVIRNPSAKTTCGCGSSFSA